MFRSFAAILGFELSKALRSRLTWVTLLLPVALTLLSVAWDQATRGVGSAGASGASTPPSAYVGFARAASNGITLGGLLLLLYSSMLVASEGHWRTFKTIMLRPHRRIEWIAGKFALLFLLSIVLLACVMTAAFLAARMSGRYGDIAEEGYVIFEAAFMRRSSLAAIALAVGPLVALAAFGLMFSTMTDHTGIATSASLGAYFVLEMAKSSTNGGRNFFFNTFVPSLSDTSYFQALRGFAQGLSDTGWEDITFRYNVGTPVASAALFLAIAALIFCRRDFIS